VLVETQLSEDSLQARIVTFSHKCIVKAIGKNFGLTEGFGLFTSLVAQRLDGIQPRGLDCRQHSAHNPHEA